MLPRRAIRSEIQFTTANCRLALQLICLLMLTNCWNFTICCFRFKQGTPGYLVAWNIGNHEKMVSFRSFSIVPEDLLVVFKSNHSFQEAYDLKYVYRNRVCYRCGKNVLKSRQTEFFEFGRVFRIPMTGDNRSNWWRHYYRHSIMFPDW